MATNIKLKKSSVPGRAPNVGDLEYGEVAINYADGRLYYKTSSNTIDYVSRQDSAFVSSVITKTFIDNLDVNAGTLDGQDGTYFLNYNNFINTPNIPDSAFVSQIAAATPGPTDSASVLSIVDSDYITSLVNEQYVATIVDSAYIAVRIAEFADAFGTVAVVGALSIDADAPGDTVTFAAGPGVDIQTDPGNKRITISSTVSQAFDFGTFGAPASFTLDLGSF